MLAYHVTKSENLAPIMCNGLMPRDTMKHNYAKVGVTLEGNQGVEAVYLWLEEDQAFNWLENECYFVRGLNTVIEIEVEENDLEPDPVLTESLAWSSARRTTKPISPENVHGRVLA